MSLEAHRREELIDQLALRTMRLGLATPAILLLETCKPLAFLGGQMMWAAQPFLNLWWKEKDLTELAQLLEDGEGVESLIERLESPATP